MLHILVPLEVIVHSEHLDLYTLDLATISLVSKETLRSHWELPGWSNRHFRSNQTPKQRNFEKRNCNRKIINELRKQDGVEIRQEKEILKVIQEFYEDLYSSEISTSQEQFDLFTRNPIFPKLADEDREEIEGPLTRDERKSVIELFQENKSPGEDGFTVEFYKYFFDSVGSYLLESLNAAYEVGKLSISQRLGVITLIPNVE